MALEDQLQLGKPEVQAWVPMPPGEHGVQLPLGWMAGRGQRPQSRAGGELGVAWSQRPGCRSQPTVSRGYPSLTSAPR